MRFRPLAAAGLIGVAFLGLGIVVAGVPAAAGDRTVFMVSPIRFQPPDFSIFAGDRVTWVYDDDDGAPHTVTSEPSSPEQFDSSPNCPAPNPLTPDDCLDEDNPTYRRRFNNAGTFEYFCRVHRAQGMTGVVRVHAKPTGGTSPTPTPTTTSPSPSPSGSGTESPSPGATPSPTGSLEFTPTPSPTDTSTPQPAPGGGATNVVGVVAAVVGLAGLGGAGYVVYRRFVSPG